MELVPAIQGAGPELLQYQKAAVAFQAALVAQPVYNHQLAGHPARPWFTGDTPSPQVFTPHPILRDALTGAVIGIEVSYAHLPGRQPPAGWDGEPGAGSPVGNVS